LCEVEPSCQRQGGACSSRCGDGFILAVDGEDCDDGNTSDGDGCSSACEVEPGYTCIEQSLPASITLPFIVRDFIAFPNATSTMQRHPDFQNGCLGAVIENMTNSVLDLDGKPTNSGSCALPANCVLNIGYLGPSPGQCDDLDGSSSCGNPNACLRSTHPNHPIAGHPGVDPFYFWYRDTADVNTSVVIPTVLTQSGSNVYGYNSAIFFPLDNDGWLAAGEEDAWNTHNYGFTTEVRYWFMFQDGQTLTFTGDDDLFVFVNGLLVLPMGSKHAATTRTVVLNADGTATCAACATMSRNHGMTLGNVYEVVIFHAERQTAASNFNLSLTGFVSAKSECALQ